MIEKSLAVFEDYKIRRVYDENTETWYFSLVDIIQVLIQQPDYQTARKYWNKLEAKTGRKVVTGESFLPPFSRKELPKSKK